MFIRLKQILNKFVKICDLPLLPVKKQNGREMEQQVEGMDYDLELCTVYKEVDKMVESEDKQPWVSMVDS